MSMPESDNPDYLEWLAAAPKGVRWDRAQEMWEEYQRKRRETAAAVAQRLLGRNILLRWRKRCPSCFGHGGWCDTCLGEGEVDDGD